MHQHQEQQTQNDDDRNRKDATEWPDRCDLFRFIRLIMYMAGMVPYRLSSQQRQNQQLPIAVRGLVTLLDLCLELFLYFVTMHIWLLYVYTLVLTWHDGDLEFLVSCLIQAVIYCWTVAMKLYFRRIQPRRLERLINYINDRYHPRSAVGFTYVTMKESMAFAEKCCKVFVYCCFIGTIFWLIVPLVNRADRTLPLACWYPFDYKQQYIYEVVYALQSIGQLEVASAFSASSCFHMVLAVIISGQYDVLYCNLKNLYAGAYIRAGATKKVLRSEMQLAQKNADAEAGQYYCAEEHNVDLAYLPLPDVGGRARMSLTQMDNDKHGISPQVVHELKIGFRKCVDHHRYIIGALQQMEAFYTKIWFFKTGEVTFLMCLVAFVSVKSTSASSSFLKTVTLAQYLVLVAWEMLIICYFGEMILINSRRCGDALLRSPWHIQIREMRLDFLFFILNSQRAFRLTAGKMSVLNVDKFRGIMATAFSFLTILQKMDSRG